MSRTLIYIYSDPGTTRTCMVACTARPQSANGSEPRAGGRQPGSCCSVCWVGLRRVPCRSRRAANRLMGCPAQRETRQGASRRQQARPWQWHAWQRADTEAKPRIWPSKDLIRQLTIRLVAEGGSEVAPMWPFSVPADWIVTYY